MAHKTLIHSSATIAGLPLTGLLAGLTLAGLIQTGCRHDPGNAPLGPAVTATEATRLAQATLIIDTHIDLPYRLQHEPGDVSIRNEQGHFDAVRAREGGLDAAFMSIYVPASLQGTGTERALADQLIDLVEEAAAAAPEVFTIVRSPAALRGAADGQAIALALGIENGAAIEDDLQLLEHFFERGVRYVTLAHSKSNLLCDSSYDSERRWNGLSPFGRQAVIEMNRLGIMVDVSHVTDDTFFQAIETSVAPVIASHSCCRHFTPGFERNMSDEMITLMAQRGGVIQIAFAPSFLTEAAHRQSQEAWDAVTRYLEENGLDWESEEVGEQFARYFEQHTPVPTSVVDVVDHIEHVIDLVGIDHVGLGSDFDGISRTPDGLADVSGYPAIIAELVRRGYEQHAIRKICGENLLRVWDQVERTAATLQGR